MSTMQAVQCIIVIMIGLHTTNSQIMVVPFSRTMGLNPVPRHNGYDNFMGVHGRNYRPMPRQETYYTAIGKDKLDPDSQMRLTFRERNTNFPNAMSPYTDNWDMPSTWYISGTFLNSAVLHKAGTYYIAITETGRTMDGCDPASMGKVIGSNRISSGRFVDSHKLPGVLPDKLLMTSTGTTTYASKLEGVSRSQLVGAGIAACERIDNGYCAGKIQYCATIAKDNLPATEVHTLDASKSSGVGVKHFASSLLDNQMDSSVVNFDPLFGGNTNNNDLLLF